MGHVPNKTRAQQAGANRTHSSSGVKTAELAEN